MSTIKNKYGIIYINNKRYYKENLKERDYSLEYTSPYLFTIEDNEIELFETSWVNLVRQTILSLNELKPKSNEELLAYKRDWSKAKLFVHKDSSLINHYPINDEIMININTTALHSFWIILDLLKFYDMDVNKCKLIIKRTPGAENKEVCDYFRDKQIQRFKYYLQTILDYDDKKIAIAIKNIQTLNRYEPFISPSYFDLFLCDDALTFYNIKCKLLHYLFYRRKFNEKQMEISKRYLDLLYDFYKIILV